MADIANGIVETKTLDFCAACCKRAGWELPVAGDEWDFHSMALAWRSCFVLPWNWWHRPPACHRGFARNFWSSPGQPSRIQWETCRGHSTVGMTQRALNLDRNERRLA